MPRYLLNACLLLATSDSPSVSSTWRRRVPNGLTSIEMFRCIATFYINSGLGDLLISAVYRLGHMSKTYGRLCHQYPWMCTSAKYRNLVPIKQACYFNVKGARVRLSNGLMTSETKELSICDDFAKMSVLTLDRHPSNDMRCVIVVMKELTRRMARDIGSAVISRSP
jgi:hypothetical protein